MGTFRKSTRNSNMRTSILFLGFLFFGVEGVQKIDVDIHYGANCGGYNVKIKLVNKDGQNCVVQPIAEFSQFVGKLTWEGSSLNTCQSMEINQSTKILVQTGTHDGGYDNFCPTVVSILSNRGSVYERTLPWKWFNEHTNSMPFSIKKRPGVLEMKVQNSRFDDRCRGHNVSVKLKTGSETCTVRPTVDLYEGSITIWSGELLGACSNHHATDQTVVFVQTNTQDRDGGEYCPTFVDILMDDPQQHRYSARMAASRFMLHSSRTNNISYRVTQLYPLLNSGPPVRPTTCPTDQDDFCPTNQMFAYDFAGEEQMNCLFECPRVTAAPRSIQFSNFDRTGFRCVGVNYPSIQYSWCCRTKQTGGGSSSGGLDKCSDVMSPEKLTRMPPALDTVHQDDDEEDDDIEQNAEPQCPDYGCPIENVETFYDANPIKHKKMCGPECDYIMSEDGNDPFSGIHCTNIIRKVQKARYCCNDVNANTELPPCNQINSPQPDPNPNPNPIQQDTPISTGDCPVHQPNYKMIEGKCLYMETRLLNNTFAKVNCRNVFNGQGKLMEPRDSTTYTNLVEAIAEELPYKLWLGISRDTDAFKYITGGDLTHEHWEVYQPDNWHYPNGDYQPDTHGNYENCAEVTLSSDQQKFKKWNDLPCSAYRSSVCEKI